MSEISRVSAFHVPVVSLLGLSGLLIMCSVSDVRAGDPRCAAYGPDFVAVEGTETCLRIGGRVRVDVGNHLSAAPNTGWATGGLEPAGVRSDGGAASDTPLTRHLRLHDGVATTDPFEH